MTTADGKSRMLRFERSLDHPPEKVWRALTQQHLLIEWLMPSNFIAEVGKTFTMTAQWGEVTGTVLAVEPHRLLSYSWNGQELTSIVTWTIAPQGNGSLLRLEHTGIPAESKQAYHGARAGWPRLMAALAAFLDRNH